MEDEREKKNKRIAMATSVGFHAVLLILFFFIAAWKAPDPPLPEVGIVLNFGLDQQGSGEIQPKTPVGSEGTKEEEPAQTEPAKQEDEEIEEQIEAVEQTPIPQEVVTKTESPVSVKEKKEETKPVEKPKEKPVEVKKEVAKPKEEPKAVYKGSTQKNDSENKTAEGKAGKPGSQGDDANKTGDKGDPQGSLDAKALYGKPGGGGGGSSLDLAGWNWDEIPKPQVPNNETGRIVFEIVVNDRGELDKVNVIENSLSPEAAKACRQAVQRLTFTKTGTNVPTLSRGKITFVVRTQ